jgi:hypothetical protein
MNIHLTSFIAGDIPIGIEEENNFSIEDLAEENTIKIIAEV